MSLFGLKPIYWLLIAVFCIHIFVAAVPGNYMIYDEVYYRPASVLTVQGVADNIEHPFLSKLIVGAFILVGGDNWLMWRLPIILFAVLAVGLTYLIAIRFLSERLSLFAVGLLSLSTVFMLVGSASILDMPCLAFGLGGLLFALKGKYGLAGLLFGLSFLAKEVAVLMFGATLIYLLIKRVGVWNILFFGGVGFAVAFGGVWFYDLVWGPTSSVIISNPVIHLLVMFEYQLKLNVVVRATDFYSAWYPPISWVSPFGENAWVPLRWIWLSVGDRMFYNWQLQPNAAVEYLMFPLLFVLPVVYWFKRNAIALVSWLWLAFNFLPWLLVGFFVRTEANFYVALSAPFLAIGAVYLYSLIKNRKLKYGLAVTQLAIGLIFFLWYFPIPLF